MRAHTWVCGFVNAYTHMGEQAVVRVGVHVHSHVYLSAFVNFLYRAVYVSWACVGVWACVCVCVWVGLWVGGCVCVWVCGGVGGWAGLRHSRMNVDVMHTADAFTRA